MILVSLWYSMMGIQLMVSARARATTGAPLTACLHI